MRSCTKIGYATKELVEHAMHMAIAYGDHGRKLPTRVYLCPSCGRYHLTSQPLNKEISDE